MWLLASDPLRKVGEVNGQGEGYAWINWIAVVVKGAVDIDTGA